MENSLESTGGDPSSVEASLARASDRFKASFSDLLMAHIQDVAKLENEIKVLREHISTTNRNSAQSAARSSSQAVVLSPPTFAEFPTLERQHTDILTWEERETRVRQDALQASRPVSNSRPRGRKLSLLPESVTRIQCCTVLLRHPYFELFFGLLIASNSLFMGVHTEYESAHANESYAPWPMYAVRYCYTGLFTVELFIRAFGKGIGSFCVGRARWWNYLDLVVVLASWVEVVTDIIAFSSPSGKSSGGVDISNTRAMRILRVARLVRVLRIGRLLNFLRPLRILVYSTLHTLKTVFWALLLLLMIIYVFGMVFSQAIADHRRENEGHLSNADLDLYWGSLPKCMFTLFKAVTGGLSWHACVHPLGDLPWMWILVFILYISLTALAVMNVITGVFCQSAIDGTQTDRDIVTQNHMAMKQVYKQTIKDVFKDIDIDGSEQITLAEFEAHFQSEEARAFFASLEIEAAHAFEVFQLIDEGQGALDLEDFVNGCLRLRGIAKSLEIAKLEAMAKRLDRKVVKLLKLMQELVVSGSFTAAPSLPKDFRESVPTDEIERLPMTQAQSCKSRADREADVCNI